MKSSVRVFPSSAELAATLAEDITRRIAGMATGERSFSIALSGGSSPELLYSILGDEYSDAIPWEFVHVFWGDERCVPPQSADSNFGVASKLFLDNINIPEKNIHRMKGEEDPEKEALRYGMEILSILPLRDNIPVFDLMLLGIGDDGHTASIFPGNAELFPGSSLCVVTSHPVTKQSRLTLTGKVINNSDAVVFIASGRAKAGIIASIIKESPESQKYPAAFVRPQNGSLDWFLDEEAASLL